MAEAILWFIFFCMILSNLKRLEKLEQAAAKEDATIASLRREVNTLQDVSAQYLSTLNCHHQLIEKISDRLSQ